MADFEGLIKQALASQDDSDPAARQRIYQSSRNALSKMLHKTGPHSDDSLRQHFRRLEESIARIEASYASPSSRERDAASEVASEADSDATDRVAAGEEPGASESPPFSRPGDPAAAPPPDAPFAAGENENDRSRPEPAVDDQRGIHPASAFPDATPERQRSGEPGFLDADDTYADDTYADDTYAEGSAPEIGAADRDYRFTEGSPVLPQRKPLLTRLWPLGLALAIILVMLWVAYAVSTRFSGEGNPLATDSAPTPVGEPSEGDDGNIYITLLEPTDLSALVTAGRGSAELLTGQNRQLLRLRSLRQDNTAESAKPILLQLEKGVLQQIGNRAVTVELNAKSGSSGPGQFAIECFVGGESVCGRKRFRVGLQPEKIVFALEIDGRVSPDEEAYLAINTDVTNAADSTGSGEPIDLIYVRLRLSGG